ncbi:MAG: hypothetical protein NAOJABEB_02986 [Steroidobacteraceae bacterium]|nr:hypothetical protein [Steroidobacteraceae bacterium]
MTDGDVAELRALILSLKRDFEAHMAGADQRETARMARYDAMEARMSALETQQTSLSTELRDDLPDMVRASVATEIRVAGERIRRLLLWLIPVVMALMQVFDRLRVW